MKTKSWNRVWMLEWILRLLNVIPGGGMGFRERNHVWESWNENQKSESSLGVGCDSKRWIWDSKVWNRSWGMELILCTALGSDFWNGVRVFGMGFDLLNKADSWFQEIPGMSAVESIPCQILESTGLWCSVSLLRPWILSKDTRLVLIGLPISIVELWRTETLVALKRMHLIKCVVNKYSKLF